MKKIILSITCFLCLTMTINAQGNIQISGNPVVEDMMARYSEINKSKQFVDGWRIQLLASTDRQKVENAKQRFNNLYPNIQADWTHSAPYYRLRAGAFSSKLEANRVLYIIKRDYPSAYPAKDNRIQVFELLN